MRIARTMVSLALLLPVGTAQEIYQFEGFLKGERYGTAVAAAGDVNSDGFPDVILGGPTITSDSAAGRAEVRSGRDGSLLHLFISGTNDSSFGTAVAGIGDVNLDGFVDIAIGDATETIPNAPLAGSVSVFSGKEGSFLHQVFGDGKGAAFGTSIAPLGDTTGDGTPDYVVGSPGSSAVGLMAGIAYIVSGNGGGITAKLYVNGLGPARLGTSVAFGGFVSSPGMTGIPDVIVGAPGGDVPGYAFGFTGNGDLFWKSKGLAEGEQYGASVTLGPDLDTDGRPDYVVGAPEHVVGGSAVGRIYFMSTKTSGPIVSIPGSILNGKMGSSLATIADLDGDDRTDLIVGSPGAGRVEILSAFAEAPLRVFTGPKGFGTSVAAVGNVDQLGPEDVAIGSPDSTNSAGVVSGIAIVDEAIDAPLPLLVLDSTADIERTYVLGETLPLPETRSVMNEGVDLLDWTATIAAGNDWLDLSPNNGMVAAGNSQQVSFSFDVAGLATNVYQADVVFTQSANPANQVTVRVTLEVSDPDIPAVLCVDGPGSLLVNYQYNDPAPDPIPFLLSNCGNTNLPLEFAVSIDDNDEGWLNVDVLSGILTGEPTEVIVTLSPSTNTAPGLHQGTVHFVNPADPNQQVSFLVNLTVAVPTFIPGTTLFGTISADDDHDGGAFQGLAGMKLKLTMKGDAQLAPIVTLVNSGGIAVKEWKLKKGGKAQKRQIKLPDSGVFQLLVSGHEGSLGTYSLTTSRKLPGTAKTKEWKKLTPKADEEESLVDVPIKTLPGSFGSIHITSKGVDVSSLPISLIAPDATIFDASPFSNVSNAGVHLIAIPFTKLGTWNVRIDNLPTGKKVSVVVALQQPSAGYGKLSID